MRPDPDLLRKLCIVDGRDLRIDFFRGLALWFIYIDHVPGDLLRHLTLRGLALADAAEVFVLTAGYSVGMVYGRIFDQRGWGAAARALVGRTGTIYTAHIALFALLATEVACVDAASGGDGSYIAEMGFGPLVDQPLRALSELLLLRYQPFYIDILPLYIVLMLVSAAAMPLLRRPGVLLGSALALYAAARPFGVNLPSWPGGAWHLDPFAWQALFCIGTLLGYAPGRVVPFRWWLVSLSAAYLLAAYLLLSPLVYLLGENSQLLQHLPRVLSGELAYAAKQNVGDFFKTYMHPVRLLSILALFYVLRHAVPVGSAWPERRWAAPFVLLGQHSLTVFTLGILLSFLGGVALRAVDSVPVQAVVNAAGLAALVGAAAARAHFRRGRAAPLVLSGQEGIAAAAPNTPERDRRGGEPHGPTPSRDRPPVTATPAQARPGRRPQPAPAGPRWRRAG